MDVKIMIGVNQRGIKITMFDAVATTTFEMAGTTCFPGACTNMKSNVL
jgi:hypothetical protein